MTARKPPIEFAPGTTQPTKVKVLSTRKPGRPKKDVAPRPRGRPPGSKNKPKTRGKGRPPGSPNRPKAPPLPSSEPGADDWSELHRLGVLIAMQKDLQTMWGDRQMPARDRVPLSRQVANLAEQIQAERARIAAENPEPVLAVDQEELVAEVVGGLAELPRSMLDAIAARLEVIRNEK